MIRATELLHDQALLELMPTAVYVIDADGFVKSFNTKACKIWGRTPVINEQSDEKWCGGYKLFLPDGTFMPHDKTPMVTAVREGASTKNAEVVIQQIDGTETTVLVNISPIRDGAGKIVGAINAFQDVTAFINARDELQQKQVELEKAVAARDTFLSVCSHELKTPLTSLKFQTDMAKRSLAKNDPSIFEPKNVQEMIMQSDRQLARLNRLVDDMLDLARIESGTLAMSPEDVDLVDMFSDVIARFEMTPGLVSIVAPGKVNGVFDRFRLEQVAMNLISNALKYGLDKPVEIQIEKIGNEAFVQVKDQGMGIKPADQERVFGRFERAVSEKNISGFGLGLYVSKQIVESHKGQISLKSEPGFGSTISLTLPLAAPQIAVVNG